MIKLKIKPGVFNKIYLEHQMDNDNRTQVYFGGSSSGKSVSLAQRTVLDVFKGDRNYLIVRQVQSTIKKSVFNEVTKAINRFKLKEYFNINKSDLIITCKENDKQILFAGLDDTEKIKSITPADGVITDIWIEEATEIEYKSYKQLNKRLRGRSKAKKRMTLSFNPIMKDHWIYMELFKIWDDKKQYVEKDGLSILKTTYKDNKFLTKEDVYDLENETDKYYYEVYTLGNWGVLGALIFKNWIVEDISDIIPTFDKNFNGVDWGYSTDPFAFIRSHYDKSHKRLYIYDERYLYQASNEIAGNEIKPIISREIVTCDSSEPKSVADFKTIGILAKSAKKGKGSIEHGIKFLKSLEIIIHVDCVNTKMEFSKYKWKEDRNGNVLPIPVDKDNHLIDALRYSLEKG